MAEIGRALLKSALARFTPGAEGARHIGSQLPQVAGTTVQGMLESLQDMLDSKITEGDARLSDARDPKLHAHAVGDLPVAGSGTSSASQVVRADDARLSNPRTPSAHSHPVGDLPVAPSGNSSSTQVVRADDSRLSNQRAPAPHNHAIGDLPVAASGSSSTTQVVRADDSRLSNSRTPSAHSHAIGDLPVASSGESATEKVVRSDDARLSNPRTPAAHSHNIGDLPVAASGAADSTKVVRSDDARLSDPRTPGAHDHDGRYYTETEVDAALSTKSDAGHGHAQLHNKSHDFFSSDHSDVDTSDIRAHLDNLAWDANVGKYVHVAPGGVPDATETQKGAVELATAGETQAGTDGARAVHPQGLKSEFERRGSWSAGDIKASARPTPEAGWLLCNGAAVSRATYAGLFTAIATAFGSGNGSSTFNVPDARSRAQIGAGQGSGLASRSLGQSVGSETHTLAEIEMPNHRHLIRGTDPANTTAGGGAPRIGNLEYYPTGNNTGGTSYEGGGAAHNNMQPSLVLNYFIKT